MLLSCSFTAFDPNEERLPHEIFQVIVLDCWMIRFAELCDRITGTERDGNENYSISDQMLQKESQTQKETKVKKHNERSVPCSVQVEGALACELSRKVWQTPLSQKSNTRQKTI